MTSKALSQEELAAYCKNPHQIILYANRLRTKMIYAFLAKRTSRIMALLK